MDQVTTTHTTRTRCDYCGHPTPDGERLHEMCALEVGPMHSCPDYGTTPCPSCDPEESR